MLTPGCATSGLLADFTLDIPAVCPARYSGTNNHGLFKSDMLAHGDP